MPECAPGPEVNYQRKDKEKASVLGISGSLGRLSGGERASAARSRAAYRLWKEKQENTAHMPAMPMGGPPR